MHLLYSRFMFLTNSLLRTGMPSNRLLILTMVPFVIGAGVLDWMTPSELYSTKRPVGAAPVEVVTVTWASAQRDDNASPLKPKERTLARSLNERSFDV